MDTAQITESLTHIENSLIGKVTEEALVKKLLSDEINFNELCAKHWEDTGTRLYDITVKPQELADIYRGFSERLIAIVGEVV